MMTVSLKKMMKKMTGTIIILLALPLIAFGCTTEKGEPLESKQEAKVTQQPTNTIATPKAPPAANPQEQSNQVTEKQSEISVPKNTGKKSIPTKKTAEQPKKTTPANISTTPQKKGITMQQVSQHSAKNDCWFVLHNKVYDVTLYIASHPGGVAIVQGCGKDATTLFETRPMGSGTPHSQNARKQLDAFFVGDLVQ